MRVTPSLRKSLGELVHYTVVEPVQQEPRILLLSLSTMFITMGQGISVPVLPLLVRSLGMSAAMVGLAISTFALARVFTNIPAGMLTRRSGVRLVLVLGALFSVIGNLLIGLIPQFGPLVVFRFVAGIGSGLFITGAVIFVAEVSTPANRGRMMTVYQSAFLLGISLGPSVGGITAALFGLTAPFFLVAAVSGLAGLWTLARIPADVGQVSGRDGRSVSRQQEATENGPATPSILRNPGFIAVSLIAFGTFFTRGGALFNLWPLMVRERFALGPGRLGLLLTVSSVANLVCQPLVGALTDRLGRKALIVPSAFLFAASLLISAVSPGVGLFVVALVIYGIAQAIEGPSANSYVADLAPRQQRAMALSINRTFGDVGLVVGSPLLGFIADQVSIPWGLVANAGLVAVPGLLFLLLARETAGRSAASAAGQTRP